MSFSSYVSDTFKATCHTKIQPRPRHPPSQSTAPSKMESLTASEHHPASPAPEKREEKSTTFLSLPPELILRALVFVARRGGVKDLAHLRQTSKVFYILLSDSGPQNDKRIWREVAVALLGSIIPTVLTVEATWQEFVKRIWAVSKPNRKGADNDSKRRHMREIKEGEVLYTSHDGPFPPPGDLYQDCDISDYEEYADSLRWTEQKLPPVPTGAKRVIEFVHSGTEGSRADRVAYSGADSGAFITFSDVPELWDEAEGLTRKGYILGDSEAAKEKKVLVTGGVQDIPWLSGPKAEFVAMNGFTKWIRSCVCVSDSRASTFADQPFSRSTRMQT